MVFGFLSVSEEVQDCNCSLSPQSIHPVLYPHPGTFKVVVPAHGSAQARTGQALFVCTGIADADGATKPSSLFEAQALHSHYSVVSW